MRQCWHADPRERPTFPDIISRIGHRLQQIATNKYDYVDAVSNQYVSSLCSSNDFVSFTVLLCARYGGQLI